MPVNLSSKILRKPSKSNPNYAEALAKFWMIVAAVLIAMNLFFVLTLLQMAPELKIISQVLTEPMNSNQFIQAEPFESDISDKNLIEQMMVRNYITHRYTMFPDEEEMNFQWGPNGLISQLSIGRVYSAFYESLGELPKQIRQMPFTQGVDIRSINRHNDIWTVEFDIYRMAGGALQKQTKVAVLKVGEHPVFRFYRTDFSNPYGFHVITYTDAEKKQGSS